MAWECKSCHRSISLDPDPRGCDDEPICWHCLYEQREALLEACEELDAFARSGYQSGVGSQIMRRIRAAIAAAKGA